MGLKLVVFLGDSFDEVIELLVSCNEIVEMFVFLISGLDQMPCTLFDFSVLLDVVLKLFLLG